MKIFREQKNKGFTLVETLVAISIFTISLLGLMSVLASGISDTTYAKRKVTADYLGQEAVEYVRNVRDTYVLYNSTDSQTGWNNFKALMASCTAGNECGFDNTVFPLTGFLCSDPAHTCKLYLSNGNYNSNSSVGADSGFVRKIWSDTTGLGSNEIKIYSKVFWTQGSGNYSTTFSEDLFNWVQ